MGSRLVPAGDERGALLAEYCARFALPIGVPMTRSRLALLLALAPFTAIAQQGAQPSRRPR